MATTWGTGWGTRWAAAAVLLGLTLPAPRARTEGATVTLAVVVASDSKVGSITKADLERIFRTERSSGPDGRRVIPVNHPPRTPDRVRFDRLVLGMAPDQVGRFWVDRRIRGGNGPPRTVDDLDTLRRVVAQLEGAMGYLRPADARGLKVLAVDGKLPGEAGYPIADH